MELKFGNKYVIEISFLIALFLCIWFYKLGLFDRANSMIVVVFISLFYTMPGLLRFLFCMNWRNVDAKIKETKDLSKEIIDWRGAVIPHYWHKAKIEYTIEGKTFDNTVTSIMPFGEKCRIYYKPNNPSIVLLKKSLGWRGSICLIIIFSIILYELFPNFFLFDLLKKCRDFVRN